MFQNLHFYIDLNWESFIDNPKDYLPKTFQVVELLYQHKATVYCSKQQIDNFRVICNEDKNFIQSIGNKLELILKNAKHIDSNFYFFEICFAKENSCLKYINNVAISSITSHTKLALISISEKEQNKILLNVKSDKEFEKFEFHVLNNKKDIANWIVSNSNERFFHKSDKHGENGKGNWPNESVLLCNKEQAQELLFIAIPNFIEKGKRLFAFDESHQTFIEFYYEGDNPQNQWHGFHVKESEWDIRVPLSIRKYFDKK